MKTYQVVIAVLVAIVFLGFCIQGCSGSNPKKAIERVLEEDRRISDRAPALPSQPKSIDDLDAYFDAIIKNVKFNVTEMGKIDLSACPDDFARAYRQHYKAWVDVSDYTERVPADLASALGFWDLLFGGRRLKKKNAELEQEGKKLNEKVEETYDQVLEIASKYGVRTSKYRNSH